LVALLVTAEETFLKAIASVRKMDSANVRPTSLIARLILQDPFILSCFPRRES
jgi:hypothetical protein